MSRFFADVSVTDIPVNHYNRIAQQNDDQRRNCPEEKAQSHEKVSLFHSSVPISLAERLTGNNCSRLAHPCDADGTELLGNRSDRVGGNKCTAEASYNHRNRIVSECKDRITYKNRDADTEVFRSKRKRIHKQIFYTEINFFIEDQKITADYRSFKKPCYKRT